MGTPEGWKGKGFVHLLGALQWVEGLIIQNPTTWPAHIFSSFLCSLLITPQKWILNSNSWERLLCPPLTQDMGILHQTPLLPRGAHRGPGKEQDPLLNHCQPSSSANILPKESEQPCKKLLPALSMVPESCSLPGLDAGHGKLPEALLGHEFI